MYYWEFPVSSLVRTLCFHCRGLGPIPGQETEIPNPTSCTARPKKKKSVLTLLSMKNFTFSSYSNEYEYHILILEDLETTDNCKEVKNMRSATLI